MPGIVASVAVTVGDTVTLGQTVLVLEAMKMENAVVSPRAGKVAAVQVKKGDEVAQGATLVTFE